MPRTTLTRGQGRPDSRRRATVARGTRTIKPSCAVCGAKRTETCADCGKPLCDRHSYVRTVDGNNSSITLNSGTVCFECHPESKAQV